MSKYKTPFNIPEGYERELLNILIEECSEIQQRATKALRFGLDETQEGQPFNNSHRLAYEIGDLIEVIDRCKKAGIIDDEYIIVGVNTKAEKLEKYMQFNTTFMNYEDWLHELQAGIEEETGIPRDQHQQVFNIKDDVWFDMYNEGMTPKEAMEAELQSYL